MQDGFVGEFINPGPGDTFTVSHRNMTHAEAVAEMDLLIQALPFESEIKTLEIDAPLRGDTGDGVPESLEERVFDHLALSKDARKSIEDEVEEALDDPSNNPSLLAFLNNLDVHLRKVSRCLDQLRSLAEASRKM